MFKKAISSAKRLAAVDPQQKCTKGWDSEKKSIRNLLEHKPTLTLSVIIILIISSFSYLIYYRSSAEKKDLSSASLISPVTAGINGILTSAAALSEMITLQAQLDKMLAKDSLIAQDSIEIERALDRIQLIEKKLGWTEQHDTSSAKLPHENKTTRP